MFFFVFFVTALIGTAFCGFSAFRVTVPCYQFRQGDEYSVGAVLPAAQKRAHAIQYAALPCYHSLYLVKFNGQLTHPLLYSVPVLPQVFPVGLHVINHLLIEGLHLFVRFYACLLSIAFGLLGRSLCQLSISSGPTLGVTPCEEYTQSRTADEQTDE